MNKLQLFITTIVGFENELLKELQASERVLSTHIGKGGVYAEVSSFQDVLFLNYTLHTANRVLVEMISLPAPRQRDIIQSLYNVSWKQFFRADETFCIEVPFSTHPDFTNTLYAAQCMKDPICDRLRKETGKRPSIDTKKPTIRFQALLTEDEFCFYFDSSTVPLFKRGYRSDVQHVAPLKETLAAALLLRAGFQPGKDILIDPCAGSGTFLVEALLLSHKIAPGLLRKEFGFLSHPLYDSDEDRILRQSLMNQPETAQQRVSMPIAIEKDMATYRGLLQHLTRAGLLGSAHVIHGAFQSIDVESIASVNEGRLPTFLVANPPYGVRMKSPQHMLERLYSDLGSFIKHRLNSGSVGALLIPEGQGLQRCVGLKPRATCPVSQGGIDCRWVMYEIF